MGHFYERIKGEGRNKEDAIQNGIDQFIHENGHRHSVRDIYNKVFIEKVPPFGVIRKEGSNTVHDFTRRNYEAPQSEWLEVWEFELHTHA